MKKTQNTNTEDTVKENVDIIELTFDGYYFDAVICLDATLPQANEFKSFAGLPLLAADGAALRVMEMGMMPDYVIGDLDTFYGSNLSKHFDPSRVIHIAEQETNDFEKTLKFATEKGYRNIIILGIHGGELEHTLNNWSVLSRFSKSLNLCVYDQLRYGVSIDQSFRLKTMPGEIISLVPQPFASLTTKNLKWNLNAETLALGSREGARNVAIADYIEVRLHKGELFVFFDERLPFAPRKIK